MASNKLNEVLENEGITKADLAKEAGLSAGSIYKFCSNSRTPSPVTQTKIVIALNVIKNSNRKYKKEDIF